MVGNDRVPARFRFSSRSLSRKVRHGWLLYEWWGTRQRAFLHSTHSRLDYKWGKWMPFPLTFTCHMRVSSVAFVLICLSSAFSGSIAPRTIVNLYIIFDNIQEDQETESWQQWARDQLFFSDRFVSWDATAYLCQDLSVHIYGKSPDPKCLLMVCKNMIHLMIFTPFDFSMFCLFRP